MKKVVLILATAFILVACKNKNQNNNQNDNGSVKSIVIDTTNACYRQSFVFDVQYSLNNGKNDTLRHITNQPNFNKCESNKWCLVDSKTSNVMATDVKSYKVLSHYFDTTQYILCSGNR
jgi:hypothetical protein